MDIFGIGAIIIIGCLVFLGSAAAIYDLVVYRNAKHIYRVNDSDIVNWYGDDE